MDQRAVWNAIAPSWSRVRTIPIPEVQQFLADKSGQVLDVGCGSGRNFAGGTYMIGVDFSCTMCQLAAQHAHEKNQHVDLVVGDASALPFQDASFHTVLCIAALHCIPQDKHKQTLAELYRVMKHGGVALFRVWNRELPRFSTSESFVDWMFDRTIYKRYYYLFDRAEFQHLLESAGFEIIRLEKSKDLFQNKTPKNIFAEVKKP